MTLLKPSRENEGVPPPIHLDHDGHVFAQDPLQQKEKVFA